MAELKPLGSEKLDGDEKLKRILELTYYQTSNKKTSKSPSEMVVESKNGGVFGIVRERDSYYVKKGLNESSLDYIGGMFMKNKNKFSSYGEALKRLELLKGQEELQESTKYVLKQTKPQVEAPMPEPSMDVPPAPEGPMPEPSPEGSDLPVAEPEFEPDLGSTEEEGSTEGKRSDYMAEVQKFSGKLGQELRDQQNRMESDDIKYVLNMIISAVDLDKLDVDDIEEIAKKFERDEEEDFSGEDESPIEDEAPIEEPEDDLSEVDYMEDLESFINTPIEADEIDLSKYADLGEDDVQELDLDEIKAEINKSIGDTLSKYFN